MIGAWAMNRGVTPRCSSAAWTVNGCTRHMYQKQGASGWRDSNPRKRLCRPAMQTSALDERARMLLPVLPFHDVKQLDWQSTSICYTLASTRVQSPASEPARRSHRRTRRAAHATNLIFSPTGFSPVSVQSISDDVKRGLMSSTNKVFLLGAGFSMAVSAGQPSPTQMPSMQGLSDGVLEFLSKTHPRRRIPDPAHVETINTLEKLAKDLGTSDHLFTIQKAYQSIREMALSSLFPGIGTPLVNNFEQWLSYLIESPPWLTSADQARNRAAFLDIAEAVGRVLESRQRGTVEVQGGECPEWLASLVQYWESTGATVLTFNYDRLVELAWLVNVEHDYNRSRSWDLYPIPVTPLTARSGAFPAVYCVPGEFQLYKLHGSLGWWYSGPDGPASDVIYDQGMTGGSWTSDGLDADSVSSISLLEDREQMIIPPAAIKSPYYNNAALRMMWRHAAADLTIADELIIMGFSLPASDMLVSSMLTTNLRNTTKITPVDFGDDIAERIRAVFDLGSTDDRLNTNYVGLGEAAISQWVSDNVG